MDAHTLCSEVSWPIACVFLNFLLFSQLRALCDSQPCSCDTATFVHMHPSEAI